MALAPLNNISLPVKLLTKDYVQNDKDYIIKFIYEHKLPMIIVVKKVDFKNIFIDCDILNIYGDYYLLNDIIKDKIFSKLVVERERKTLLLTAKLTNTLIYQCEYLDSEN